VKGAEVGEVVVGVEEIWIPIRFKNGRVTSTLRGKKIVIGVEDAGFGGVEEMAGQLLQSICAKSVSWAEGEHPDGMG
jgi:hypothetical protein